MIFRLSNRANETSPASILGISHFFNRRSKGGGGLLRGCLGERRRDQKSLKEHKGGNYRTLTINEAGEGGGLLKCQRDKRERGLVQVNCVVTQPISSVLPPSLRSLRLVVRLVSVHSLLYT